MKGVVICCLAEVVEARFGKEAWRTVLKEAHAEGVPGLRLATSDIDDALTMRLIQSTMSALHLNLEEVADAFGEYWCCKFAPPIYGHYFKRFSNAREMILGIDQLHVELTEKIPNARPPRFDYQWQDERTLRVTYKSRRNLIDLYVGIARGVGKRFNEALEVKKISSTQCVIRFPSDARKENSQSL